jgi:hypothetical protein
MKILCRKNEVFFIFSVKLNLTETLSLDKVIHRTIEEKTPATYEKYEKADIVDYQLIQYIDEHQDVKFILTITVAFNN